MENKEKRRENIETMNRKEFFYFHPSLPCSFFQPQRFQNKYRDDM